MIHQGDIILVDLNPVKGHEEGKKRPVLVVSNDDFIKFTRNLVKLVPISSTKNDFPLHIPLPKSLKTKGVVLTQHERTVDINARGYRFIEKVPDDFLNKVITILKTMY
ncbi:MAG: type II toxin-antitoxin system PemK/MazF family toxin [Candidatus Paralactobacillus gallistercoris]|uniref:Type II toxin-antitoxin system PemK/MazF family toxin n=1 Tax=Candidatus Paralactobacillus gallistercoris TaxID=2838724 RepID=A0A948TIY7_9LACO|nr:type II toxin-antitoxin system PemK/MazF family toxin [Candidatus Paralactobacillus gallistercoris]